MDVRFSQYRNASRLRQEEASEPKRLECNPNRITLLFSLEHRSGDDERPKEPGKADNGNLVSREDGPMVSS